MEKYDFVVLGAGVAGLSFSKRVSEAGYKTLVLEKEKVVGGLSRTLSHNGFRLDFCAHRFHTNNEELLKEVLALDFEFNKYVKKSRIYMFRKYLKYPFEMQNLLRAMPIYQSFMGGFSFLTNFLVTRLKKSGEVKSYKEWFVRLYGNQLYKIMCEPYTSKIWHMDPATISADWADQRFQGENLVKLMKRIVAKLLRLDFSKYSLEDDTLAPDGGVFYYPLEGIQEIPNALAKRTREKGGMVLCSSQVIRVSRKDKTIEYLKDGKKNLVGYEKLISTIPLSVLYKLQEQRAEEVDGALAKIKYMDIIFVYLFADKKQISNDHWLYFPDQDIIFNRAVEFSNWTPKMCPEGKTSVCFDITCYENDEIWKKSDTEIADRVIKDADRIGYMPREVVSSSFVFRLKYAYPVYDLEYKDHLDKIVKFFEDGNTYLLGRTGIFRYNNSDNSIEMGFELARKLVGKEKNQSIYNYQIKKISY